MAKILVNSNTMKELVEIFTPFMEAESKRRSFLLLALGNDASVLKRISWSGDVATFIPQMVCTLVDYGESGSGKQTLLLLLEYARTEVGLDIQQHINELIDKLQIVDIVTPVTSPLSSLTESEYRELVEKVSCNGEISISGLHILETTQQRLGISMENARKIKQEVLQEFCNYQQCLDNFWRVLVEETNTELPLSQATRNNLAILCSQLKNTDVETVYLCLANVFFENDEIEKSIDLYKEAIMINNENLAARQRLAYIFLQKEQLDNAIIEYQQIVHIEPNNISFHVTLGNILYAKGQFEKSKDAYQKAIEFRDDDTSDDLAEVYYLFGCTLYECEQYEDAIRAYFQAINIKPQYAEAYAEIGRCQNRLGKFVDADINLRTAIATIPDNAEFHFYLGIVSSSQCKYKDAIFEFEEAIKLNIRNSTPDPKVYTHYSFALLGMNKQKRAESEIKTAIELFRRLDMNEAAKLIEYLFDKIKKESSWLNFFKLSR